MWVLKPNSITSGMRSTWATGAKIGLLGQASIVGENMWIAPDITRVINEITSNLPNVLTVSTDLPGVTTAIGWIASKVEMLESLGADFHNFANITAYTWALWLLYIVGRVLGWEKWRLEALGGSVVLTAISVGLFSEMYDTLQSNGRDLLWYLPRNFYDSLPDGMDNYLGEIENRQAIYGAIAWIVWIITGRGALKNIERAMTWRKKNL